MADVGAVYADCLRKLLLAEPKSAAMGRDTATELSGLESSVPGPPHMLSAVVRTLFVDSQ